MLKKLDIAKQILTKDKIIQDFTKEVLFSDWDKKHSQHKLLEVKIVNDKIGIRFEGEDIEEFKDLFQEKILS